MSTLIHQKYLNSTINLNDDGTFTFEKELEKPKTIILLYGRNRSDVYIAPGESVALMVDAADWKNTQSFSGDLALENNYLLEKAALAGEWQKNYMNIIVKEPLDYKASRDSMQGEYMALLDSYKGLSKDFSEVEKLTLDFGLYGDLNNYQRAHQYYAKVENVD